MRQTVVDFLSVPKDLRQEYWQDTVQKNRLSLFIICINAGQFLNPYWGSFLGNILGGGDGSAHSKVVGSMIILAVCCVVALFAAGKVGGKVKEPAEA